MVETVELIAAEGDRLLAVARQDLMRPVPQYPGWTMSDLLSHTGSVLGRTVLVCRDRLRERPVSPKMQVGDDPGDWLASNLEAVCETFELAAPDTPVWGFGPSPDVRFWVKRMLIEVGVHRWDVDQAYGRPRPLLDEVALAGLDEFPTMWLPQLGELVTIRVVANDLGRDWVYGHGEPVATIESSGSDLYLRLMSRASSARFPDDWQLAVDALSPPPR